MAPAQPSRAYNLFLLTSTFLASKRHAIHAQISDWKPVLDRWAHSPIFQSRVFTALWKICQFLASSLLYGSHIIVSVGVFKYTHRRVKEFLSSYLPGSWGVPYFPIYRSIFIYLLVTLPLWGLAMTIFTASWFAATQLWSCLQRWRHRRNYYRLGTGMDLDLQPLNEEEDEPRSVSFPRDSKRASSRSGWAIFRAALWLLLYTSYLALALSGVYLLKTYELPGDHRYRGDVEKAIASPRREGYGSGEKIFIAAMFRDNEVVLPYWIKEMTKFIYYAGPDNIFVSIVESNSGDKSPVLLEEFDAQLESMGVARRILTRDTSIPRPPDMSGTPRIEFLSAVRNRVMEPLVEKGGYEKVIFSNDIYIEAESVVELLKSRDGDWDFVCGLDFGYWGLYDLWVIRDKAGAIPSTNWPYFLEWTGLHAIMRDDPAPAFACWNGIVAFKAEPFLPLELRTPGRLSTSPSKPLAPTHPAFPQPPDLTPAQTPPVRFRASTEKECYSSESFNLPYDFRRQFDLQNIYVNPRVINAYVWEYYVWYKYLLRHWAVKWWMEKIENGYEMQVSKLVIGGPDGIWRWDGGECHPW